MIGVTLCPIVNLQSMIGVTLCPIVNLQSMIGVTFCPIVNLQWYDWSHSLYHCKFTIWKTEWLKQSMTDDYGASVYCKYRNAKNNPQK